MKAQLKFSTIGTLLLILTLAISVGAAAPAQFSAKGKPPTATPGGELLAVTVSGTQIGITQQSIGTVEGNGGFNLNDLTDLGITNYRMYGGASRYEPADDDAVYGSPTIADIQANPNVINWAAWDAQFNRTDGYFWSQYPNAVQVSSATMLSQLQAAGIQVVMTIRPRDNNNTPTWINPIPITAAADRNEWWEHVFATVYEINVRNNWGVDRWEIHNEPNQVGQGWYDNGGSLADYYEFVRLTSDAIDYVYATYLGNRPHFIHAPVVSGNPNRSKWVPGVLDNVDSYFNVFDYHWYGIHQDTEATDYIDTVTTHNPDGVVEPLWNSEWGTFRDPYNTVPQALGFSDQLIMMSQPASYVSGSDIFSMYTWGTAAGLVDDAGVKSETYWAFQTLIPALQNGKNNFSVTGNATSVKIMGTEDATGFYIVVLNQGRRSVPYTITADISAHRATGVGTLTEYSAANKAVVVDNPAVSGGVVTFNSPADSVVVLRVP
jgi:hypothetical protein